MAVHERPHNNFVGILSVQHLSVAIFPRYQHFFIICDCIWPHKVLQHWHMTTTPCLLCTSFVNIFWQIFCFRCFDTIGYYYYYTWVLLWWRCRTTAAEQPYNVSDRTVTISVHNCSAGTYDRIECDNLYLCVPKSWRPSSLVDHSEPKTEKRKQTENKNQYRPSSEGSVPVVVYGPRLVVFRKNLKHLSYSLCNEM